MTSTTGTTIEAYLEWAKKEIEKKHYGEVSLTFTICNSQVTDVVKGSVDKDHYQIQKVTMTAPDNAIWEKLRKSASKGK